VFAKAKITARTRSQLFPETNCQFGSTSIKGRNFMQSLAFLWFELQMTKQCLSEKTFSAAQVPAKATNLLPGL